MRTGVFFGVYSQPVGLQSVAGNCFGELRAEECTVLVLEVAVLSSFTMLLAGTTAVFSLNKIRDHNQHRSPSTAFWIRPGFPYGDAVMGGLLHIHPINCGPASSGGSLCTNCLFRDRVWCYSKLPLHIGFVLSRLFGIERFEGSREQLCCGVLPSSGSLQQSPPSGTWRFTNEMKRNEEMAKMYIVSFL